MGFPCQFSTICPHNVSKGCTSCSLRSISSNYVYARTHTQHTIKLKTCTDNPTTATVQSSELTLLHTHKTTKPYHPFTQKKQSSVEKRSGQSQLKVFPPYIDNLLYLKLTYYRHSYLVYSDPTTLAYSAPTPNKSHADTKSFSRVCSCYKQKIVSKLQNNFENSSCSQQTENSLLIFYRVLCRRISDSTYC